MKVFAIVVTYNGMQWYDKCFGSLLTSTVPIKVVVIDNASKDNTVAYIKDKFPDIYLIESSENLGFAKANNIGIKYAMDNHADYVFLLNQDAWVENNTISILQNTISENKTIGIACPINMNATNTAIDWQFVTDLPGDFVSDLYMNKLQAKYDATFINAAAWLISSNCIKTVGGFDTSLFLHYGEDNNFCQRVLFHNFKIVINTECKMSHDRGFRKNIEKEYRNNSFVQPDINRRIMFGNILEPVDIDNFIKKTKRSIIKLYYHLNFKKIKEYKKDLCFYYLVKESRQKNIKGGMVWL